MDGAGTGPGGDAEPAGEGIATSCPACGEPLDPSDRFCEACGRSRAGPRAVIEIPEIRPEAVLETSSRRVRPAPPAECADCGATGIDRDGYCERCGLRQPTGNEHVEIELAGPARDGPVRAAGVSDLGRRRSRNEDALAMAALPRTVCAVVCDGVASAPGSDQAAQVAADTGTVGLADLLVAGYDAVAATRGAIQRAGGAVAELSDTRHNPPACTYVSAVVSQESVTVGWVGDSRAYWIGAPAGNNGHGGSALLTRDDSWADLMIARRAMSEEAARSDPRAHLLTGWLGADAETSAPHTVTFRPRGPGMVVICSDGLWNHLPEPSELESALREAPLAEGGLLAAARGLVQAALDAGGHDNVTVVLIPFPPISPTSGPASARPAEWASPAPAPTPVPCPPSPDPPFPPPPGPDGASREPSHE